MNVTTDNKNRENEPDTFVETALKFSGKSAEEARKTGAIDRADEQVEMLFSLKHQTTGSPVFRAVWEDQLPADLFVAVDRPAEAGPREVMQKSLDLVRERRRNKTLYDAQGKISKESLDALAGAGYWGLLVDKQYGGQGVSFLAFARFLTQMAMADATVSGLASVHGCIGAVDPLKSFGSEEQKQRILPVLASGKRISAFALTEPCAGSDLTALRTRAVLDGDVTSSMARSCSSPTPFPAERSAWSASSTTGPPSSSPISPRQKTSISGL
jgi:Acyl-CoA dehydrogenase, N-terminal domain